MPFRGSPEAHRRFSELPRRPAEDQEDLEQRLREARALVGSPGPEEEEGGAEELRRLVGE